MRFYAGKMPIVYAEAMQNANLFFINGFEEGKSAADTEADVKAFFKDTVYDGVPIIYLSKLPDFKLPEAPKVAPKPRAPMQRGTIELRMKTFTFDPAKSNEVQKSFEGASISFPSASHSNTLYVRHELAKPLLYVETNWGAPVGSFEKTCIEHDVVSALNALGLLDQFKVQAGGFETVRIALLSKAYIEDLERRKVPLVKFDSLAPAIAARLETDTALVAALRNRFDSTADWSETQRVQRLATRGFLKNIAPKIAADHMLTNIGKVHVTIENLLKADQKRGAALYMAQAWCTLLYTTTDKLAGAVKPSAIFETYPMLEPITHMIDEKRIQAHIADYINMVDAQIAAAKEAVRLEQLAQLHAEALFELN